MRKKHKSNWKQYIPEFFVGLLSISILFLLNESITRVIVLELLLLTWFTLSRILKSRSLSSIILLLITLTLNITLTLPFLVDPYVRGVYVNYLSPTISILDISIFILLLSLLFEAVKVENILKLIKSIPVWLSGTAILLLLHLIFHPNLLTLFSILRILLYLLSAYILIKNLSKIIMDKRIMVVWYTLLFTISFQVILAILQMQSGADLGLQFIGESDILAGTVGSSFLNLDSGVILRGYGTFPHPNILAGYLLTSFLLAMYFVRRGWVRNLLLIITTVGIIITFSRVAWLLLLSFCLIYSVFWIYRRVKGKGFVLTFLPLSFLERFQSLFVQGDSSVRDRLELLKHSLVVIKENWLFGVGAGNYVSTMKDVVVYTKNGLLLLQPVHNIPLLILAEYGFFGVFIFLGILYKITFFNLRRRNLPLYLSILLLILLVGFTDHYLITLPQGLVMLVVLLFL